MSPFKEGTAAVQVPKRCSHLLNVDSCFFGNAIFLRAASGDFEEIQ